MPSSDPSHYEAAGSGTEPICLYDSGFLEECDRITVLNGLIREEVERILENHGIEPEYFRGNGAQGEVQVGGLQMRYSENVSRLGTSETKPEGWTDDERSFTEALLESHGNGASIRTAFYAGP